MMTTVKYSISGEDVTSTVEGVGKEELQHVIDKFEDGLHWKLIVESKASLRMTNVLIAGELFHDPVCKCEYCQGMRDKLKGQ